MHDDHTIPYQMTESVMGDMYKRRKALLVSIEYMNEMEDKNAKPLSTPHRDARRLKHFLIKQGYPEADIVHLSDDSEDSDMRPTRANVERAIDNLVDDLQPWDRCVFFYAGHGYSLPNRKGTEIDGMDEAILLAGHTGAPVDDEGKSLDVEELEKLPIDHPQRKDLQKMDAVIIDDHLRIILVNKIPPGSSLVAILDTCHSGTLLDLTYNWEFDTTKGEYKTVPVQKTVCSERGSFYFSKLFAPKRAGPKSDIQKVLVTEDFCMSPVSEELHHVVFEPAGAPANVISISSAQDGQLAWEKGVTMTSVLLDTISKMSGEFITISALINKIRETTCGLRTSAFDLRHQKDKKDKETLRKRKLVEHLQLPEFSSLSRWAEVQAFSL